VRCAAKKATITTGANETTTGKKTDKQTTGKKSDKKSTVTCTPDENAEDSTDDAEGSVISKGKQAVYEERSKFKKVSGTP
jgi:hypothetical protein